MDYLFIKCISHSLQISWSPHFHGALFPKCESSTMNCIYDCYMYVYVYVFKLPW